ncbi:hypothetical protein BGZ74_008760 [Mortierella antarctica]|nr:hypothetical protein BGZ74_008760 [Mortierella antarctica]
MGYEYALLAAAIIIPLGLFSILKGNPSDAALASQKNSLPGAFGDSSSKAKKKKSKKKKTANGANGAANASDDSEPEDVPAVVISSAKKNDFQTVGSKKNKNKGNKNSSSSGSGETAQASSSTTAAPTSASLSSATTTTTTTTTTTSTKGSSKTTNNNNSTSPSSSSAPLTSIEKYRQQKLDQHKQQLAQQEPLKFAQAASQNAHQSPSSPNVASIPGPGAMGNNKKKNRSGAAGSGLSHAEFPTLSLPEPAKAEPKEPKAPKQKKPKDVAPAPAPVPKEEPVVASSDEEEQEKEPVLSESEHKLESEQEQEQVQDEWTTVASNPSRSGGIDFSKPMDPWVAQQQKQKLERIAAADPHGEQSTQYARVLSIKPTVKEQAIREAIPDGFSTQKSRSSGSSSAPRQYQSEEVTKKQRENLAKAAKRKEDKAAQDAIQEQRLKDHMRQVKAEKMKEFYKSQSRKQAPVESRWNAPKQPQQPSSSTVSGGMSAQVNEKGQLIWD